MKLHAGTSRGSASGLALIYRRRLGIVRDMAERVNEKARRFCHDQSLRRLVVSLLLLQCGCTQHDRECVGRIASILGRKAREVASQPGGTLPKGWQGLRISWDEIALETRVRSRLRWDKALAELEIGIKCDGGVVELTGQIADNEIRQKAVQLALATVGVERVEDKLEAPAAGP